ncbi:hypothetical protein [Nocardia donostiensis]|uniref:hypothetical protein n=1 Tax=Nocardia donostiensis TaxID=1538463 RepID=UPI0020CA2EF0|nr:hypothetical protein [Nocardia donostiensis]
MPRTVAVAAAAVALSVGLTACGSDEEGSDSVATATSTAVTSTSSTADHGEQAGEAPSPETLQATLDTLADPAVAPEEKTKLIVDGEKRTANIEQMNTALAGYGTLTFAVADVVTEGDTATAQVTITSPHGAAPALPLTWENVDGAWKLSDASGCVLFSFAQSPCAPA